MNDTIRLLGRHRSIRRYGPEPIPEEHVREAVRAGQSASTSHAVQAYALVRVTDAAARARLVELTGNQEKVATAAAFFVVCGDSRRHRLVCARAGVAYDGKFEEFLVTVIDASLFAQNVITAFESMGYGVCCVGGLRNRPFDVDRLLALPEGVYPLFGLCVGTPAEDPPHRPRLPVDGVFGEGRYPDDARALDAIDRHDATVGDYLAARDRPRQTWSALMAEYLSKPRRRDLADYYRSKGADLG